MPSSGILVIDRTAGFLEVDGMALRLRSSDGGVVPLEPVDKIILIGNIGLSTQLIHRCYEKNIDLIFLSGRHHRFAGRVSGRLHTDALLRFQQYQALTPEIRLAVATYIVRRKIEMERETLKTWKGKSSQSAEETLSYCLDRIENEVLGMETLRGLEGSAHAAYFSAYAEQFGPSWNFTHRTRRPPRDPINALLSLTYTLFHYTIVRELETQGLDPFLGFYHEIFHGRESLACDLMELFRTAVDLWVLELVRGRILRPRDFGGNRDEGFFLKKKARRRYFPLFVTFREETLPAIRKELLRWKQWIRREESPLP